MFWPDQIICKTKTKQNYLIGPKYCVYCHDLSLLGLSWGWDCESCVESDLLQHRSAVLKFAGVGLFEQIPQIMNAAVKLCTQISTIP